MIALLLSLLLGMVPVHAATSATIRVIIEKSGAPVGDRVGLILRCYGQGEKALDEFFAWTGRCTGSCTIGPVDTLPGEAESIRFCNVDATVGEDRFTAGAMPSSVQCGPEANGQKNCTLHLDIGLLRTMQKLPDEATAIGNPFTRLWAAAVHIFSPVVCLIGKRLGMSSCP